MRNDERYVQQMHGYASYLVGLVHAGSITREDLAHSIDLQLEVTMLLQIVGEAARRLRERNVDLRPRIDLRAIAGLRNRISHDYEGIDWSIVEDVVFTEMPRLVNELDAIMRERGIEPKPIG